MASKTRAVLFGVAIWLITFIVSFAIYPLKEQWRSLFESIMPVTIAFVVVYFALRYFRRVQGGYLREGIILGLLWLLISLAIDLPLMLSPPINMNLVEYLADIGLTYVIMPIITAGIGAALAAKSSTPNEPVR
jgi:hypothetical protein